MTCSGGKKRVERMKSVGPTVSESPKPRWLDLKRNPSFSYIYQPNHSDLLHIQK